MPDPALVLYYRDGCHLCEELASVLHRGWPTQTDGLDWRNVDSRDDWRRLYGLRVPVLMVGDAVICELQADPQRLKHYFGDPINPL
ncbi:MAG: glutaredoxin family protein [Gammaproteobacteria bacterium]|nr:glutaredoxin family protein [Gammaproteobacteria bacterium]